MKQGTPIGHHYSTFNPAILEPNGRLPIARHIIGVLSDVVGVSRLSRANVLDVGCSSGIITGYIAHRVRTIDGIDIDRSALTLARKNHAGTNITYRRMSATTLEYPDGLFDIVICNQLLCALVDQTALMREIYRVLKPGGACYLSAVNKWSFGNPQYHLPLAPFIPVPLARALVRASGTGTDYVSTDNSYRSLRRLTHRYEVRRLTPYILHDPEKYGFGDVLLVTKFFPVWAYRIIEPALPNFIWLLTKPKDHSNIRVR